MTTQERNKKMDAEALTYHASLIHNTKGQKGKRSCMQCRKKFLSKDFGHRICDICKKSQNSFGERAYISM